MKVPCMRISLAALAAVSLTASAASAAPKKCATQAEADALNMRVLQTDMMVGGLSCQLSAEYADFVKSQRANLQEKSEVMRKYFQRAGGGTAGMDKFVTSLANASSKQSLRARSAAFCQQAKGLFTEVKALSTTQLEEKLNKTQDITARRGIPLCAGASSNPSDRPGPKPTTPIGDALKR